MRMRFKPYAHDELMAADFHVHEPLIWGGRWHGQYTRPEQPFVLELGCGKGGFISQLACAHPENNYLGIDITDKVLILAKRKIEAAYQAAGRPIDNVKIMSTDIERIKGVITAEDTVSRIYINFCNCSVFSQTTGFAFFFSIETKVLEQQHFTRLQSSSLNSSFFAHTVVSELYVNTQQFGKMIQNVFQ